MWIKTGGKVEAVLIFNFVFYFVGYFRCFITPDSGNLPKGRML